MPVQKMKLFAIIALLALVVVLFPACGEIDTPDPSPTETQAPVAASTLDLVRDGEVRIARIVCPEGTDTNSPVNSAALKIRDALQDLIKDELGITIKKKIPFEDDFKKPTDTYDSDAIEILVGYTAYPETAEAAKGLPYGDYRITIVGNKIVVLGYHSSAISRGATNLISILKEACDKETASLSLTPSLIEKSGTTNRALSSIPAYENGKFLAYYKAGGEADEVIIGDTDMEEYEEYLKALENAGYSCYTTHVITDNKFATYTNDRYTISAGYYDYEKSARIIIEPLAKPVGLASDNQYEKITTSQITMFGLEYYSQEEESPVTNGMSMLIRLEDGRFIIIDGGFSEKNVAAEEAKIMLEQIRKQSADYASSDKEITIAAWIITHAHDDHYGMMKMQWSAFKNMKVERFLVNLISDTELEKGRKLGESTGLWGSNEGGGGVYVHSAAELLNADLQTARVGQVFYMADLKMEILYTIDSYGPDVCNAVNTTSMIIKMTFGDQTTFMLTGDSTGAAFKILYKTYGEYLKCDIVQVAHHGFTMYGDESSAQAAYKLMAPSTLLWPQGGTAYPNYTSKNYNAVLIQPSDNPNYEETFVAGMMGDIVILPLPYSVGTGVVTRTEKSNVSGANTILY